ncbi:MAG: Rpn family recombination-promoting nuclease/putative transposase [Romboutsia sp.]|uniref:Rpn family recombination-promoting nuclease/putative transposase n=1 Tax=Romboutsia sp. TaxID=1965302 RepID=UPI003F31708C
MELLDLRYDAAFKEFFKDTELLSSFISSITGRELQIESLEYTEEKAVDDGRSIIFDILAIDKDGNKINVEMEKNSASSIKKRTQFYWAKAFTRGFEKKSKFKDLKETICINILGNNIFKDEVICREYVLYDIENSNRLDECLSIYFVELQKGEYTKGESIKDLWIKILANSQKITDIPKESPIINKAVSKVYQLSEIDDIQLKVIEEALEESKRLDWQDDVLETAENMVKEAMQQAEQTMKQAEETIQQAEETIQKAVRKAEETAQKAEETAQKAQEAAKKSEQNTKIYMAKNMLINNIDVKIISNITGLEVCEIKKLI